MSGFVDDIDIDLKAIRKELGVTQQGLADLIGRSIGTVQSWEQGIGPVPKPIKLLIDRIVADHRAAASQKAAA